MTKQKYKKSTSNLKIVYIFLILILVAGATFLCLSIFAPAKKDDKPNETTNTTTTEPEKKKNDTTPTTETGDNQDKTPKKYEDPTDVDPNTINASITKNEVKNGNYSLRITIYELIDSGSCKLHMESKNGDSLDRTANIVLAGPDSSACEGFDVESVKSYLNAGSYDFTVSITTGSKTGKVEGTINIE